jgi:hypothetical protein
MIDAIDAIVLWVAVSLAIAVLSDRSSTAWIGVGLAALLLPVPAFVDGHPVTKAALTALPILALVRSLDLAIDPRGWPMRRRMLHLLSIVDSRTFVRGTPGLARPALAELTIGAALFSAAAYGATRVSGGGAVVWIRGLLGGLMLFGGIGFMSALLELTLTASGIAAPRMQEAPHRSTSLNEFWARRWNRVISAVLHERCFVPLKRRGPIVALTGVFVASAALHGYQALSAIGVEAVLPMAAFFLVQPPLLILERRMGVRQWPRPAGWVWTLLALWIAAPLLTESVVPMLLFWR